MNDQDRLDLILSQARIAKSAMAADSLLSQDQINLNLHQAILALEAIILLADPDFRSHSTAA